MTKVIQQKRFSTMPDNMEDRLTSYIEDIATPFKNQKYVRHGARWAHSAMTRDLSEANHRIQKLEAALKPFADQSFKTDDIITARLLLKLD